MKGLDLCVLWMGSRRRSPREGDQGWSQHHWESAGCVPAPCQTVPLVGVRTAGIPRGGWKKDMAEPCF